MAEQTLNYNLTKPDPSDFYDVNVQNENMDKIDAALKNLSDEIVNIDAPVKSVNNKTGDVVLNADDVGAPTVQRHNELSQQLSAHLAETASKFTNINLNIIDMAVELETLKGATLNGVTANIFIETFQNLNDINLMNGVYDSTNKRLVL